MDTVELDEKKMLSLILAKLESIEAKLEEISYPPEEAIKEDFIEKVKAAEKRIEEGKYRKLTLEEFRREFSPDE